jgi:glycosyltransferase involved in cell wall biosynthesis
MRIAIVTDAWAPQVNGVVRTLASTRAELESLGHRVEVISPAGHRSVPCPTYPEIRLALVGKARVGERIAAFAPDALHIATEGPLGLAARRWAQDSGMRFTTAFHTHFPQYLSRRTRLPEALFWQFIRRFHAPAEATLVATPSLRAELAARGIARTRLWSRGVDLDRFAPSGPRHPAMASLPGPVLLYVGRVAVEKSVGDFLALEGPGTRVVVGDGPERAALAARYPHAIFLGTLHGAELAAAYRSADVLVFPSRTDTFGLVMIEALACGTPVAAYPVAGPRDVLSDAVGAMDRDLGAAVRAALGKSRYACAAHACEFGWGAATRQFLDALAPLETPLPAAA